MTEHSDGIGPHVHAATAGSPWDIAVLTALAIAGLLYWRGSRRLEARHARVRTAEPIAFWTGWLVAIAALLPQMDRAAAELFSLHMAQHELLMLVVAPLMIGDVPSFPGCGRSRRGCGPARAPRSPVRRCRRPGRC